MRLVPMGTNHRPHDGDVSAEGTKRTDDERKPSEFDETPSARGTVEKALRRREERQWDVLLSKWKETISLDGGELAECGLSLSSSGLAVSSWS